MWDYDSLIGKAEVYFSRAEAHPVADDDEFALWLLLGLEFLLRAPLAHVHPSLLAAPEGHAILHAVRIKYDKDPKSIPTHSVIDRLAHVVPDFDSDRQADARHLSALRNNELHTGAAAVASVKHEIWLPKFMRVAQVIADHLDLDVDALVGESVAALGRKLVDADDKRIRHEVEKRIEASKNFYDGLSDDEIDGRRWSSSAPLPYTLEAVDCPNCGEKAPLELDPIRVTNETVIDDEFVSEVIMVARELRCYVCELVLSGPAEVKYAGLDQQYVRQRSESFYDRFVQDYVADDYGND